ncbi:hypothetical protein [Proteiniborus sp. MB09-C3]|uniref:hypothetical protein n=1 Tax=Proteiniborus sp. MB09-C3 TaxID=3050072 RepID=UPI002553A38C|nr:hypothetical protein [Proteiniborus sp. MB09-C3]WIV12324.1 hypothetical protein QO263_00960 [Proteiniborus sp. MB09-C3]
MTVMLLVLLLIPIFAFHVYIFVDVVSSLKVPINKTSTNMETAPFDNERASRKANIRVIK